MSDLVTGEAVALDLQVARLASRSVAFALDVALQATVLVVLYLVLFIGGAGLDSALTAAVGLLVFVAVIVGYPTLFETLTRGRTPGKMALGLRVVRDDGGPIGFRHALVRGLSGVFVDFWVLGFFGFVAMVVSLLSARGKRIGDYLAGTVVIRERVPTRASATIPMPPELARWATDLDLSRLPDTLALAARQYLGRFAELNQGARDALGDRLADEVARHIRASRPPDAPAWAFLAAVLAERRAREHAKLNTAWSRQVPEAQRRHGSTPPGPGTDFTPPG